MRLLEEVKKLRSCFPELKIRQRLDYCNRKYAEIVLPECKENPIIVFDYDFMILDFCGSRSIYGYDEGSFRYLVSELRRLMNEEILTVAYEYEGELLGAEILDSSEIYESFLRSSAKKFSGWQSKEKPLLVKLIYFNSDHDRSFNLKI